jgi:hypothetical protein
MKITGNRYFSGVLVAVVMTALFPATKLGREQQHPVSRVVQTLDAREFFEELSAESEAAAKRKDEWHPPHRVKVWKAVYKGKTFRITQLPRCEHVETLITYNPSGETLGRAKKRTGGIAACTGSFHNSRSMALADFFQRDGSLISGSKTGRPFLAVDENGKVKISKNYASVKRKPGVSALALGQHLVPFETKGFSRGFMNRQTDRMAIGINDSFIFIVQGKSDIWSLAGFFKRKLPVKAAVNSDGGHVVRGKAPVHIVFRWKKTPPNPNWLSTMREKERN